jgi:hypothetical protein
VKEEHYIRTGIYLAYPTSPETKSIYRQKSYKTLDNDTHTKVGIAKDSFKAREKGYATNFDNQVEFLPLVLIEDIEKLKTLEKPILKVIEAEHFKIGRAREWFTTNNHQSIKDMVAQALLSFDGTYEYIG